MIRTLTVTKDNKIIKDLTIPELLSLEDTWYWIDFYNPDDSEVAFLKELLNFHHLAIEDCLHFLQRPKMDYYEDHTFFVIQSLNQQTLQKEEVNIFLGRNYIVTFHKNTSPEIDEIWERICCTSNIDKWCPSHVLYQVIDGVVDNYFPIFYRIDDILNEIDENSQQRAMETLLKSLFDTRRDLLSLRHTVAPMRDLTYRMINSQRLTMIEHKKEYFLDIHDHLLKLTEMIEEDREFTTDIRDSYLSLNSHETNRVMKVLTIITTIFMPLTFIAGIYGMNFRYLPELTWRYGYFQTLAIMFIIGFGMFKWFQKKGWLK